MTKQTKPEELNHTTMPWRLKVVDTKTTDGRPDKVALLIDDKNLCISGPLDVTRATFIVRAVNEYESLRSRLEKAEEKIADLKELIGKNADIAQGQIDHLHEVYASEIKQYQSRIEKAEEALEIAHENLHPIECGDCFYKEALSQIKHPKDGGRS